MAYVFRWQGKEHGVIENTKVQDALELSNFQAFHAIHMCQKGSPINVSIMVLSVEKDELYQMIPDDIQVLEYQNPEGEKMATAFRLIDLVPTIILARDKWNMMASGCFAGIDTVAMSSEAFLAEFVSVLNGIKIPTLKGTSGSDLRVLTLESSRQTQSRDGFGTRVRITPGARTDTSGMDVLLRVLTPLFNIAARIDGITTISFTVPRPNVPMEKLYELSNIMETSCNVKLYVTPVAGNSNVEFFSFDYSPEIKDRLISEISNYVGVHMDPDSIIVPDLYGFSATVIPGAVADQS